MNRPGRRNAIDLEFRMVLARGPAGPGETLERDMDLAATLMDTGLRRGNRRLRRAPPA